MIYLLEDDQNIREFVLYALNGQGLEASGFDRPSAFWRAMEERVPELLLLDIMLPEESGLEVLQRIRAQAKTAALPVIMLTAKGTEYDKVLGLDSGADDYIPKPFSMLELISRIRALLRRAQKSAQEKSYRIDALCVNPEKHTVSVADDPISLTVKEYELLCLLLENAGIVLSRGQIQERIWGYAFDGESRTVDVHIRTLRQKLGACGSLIETVRGVGYKIEERPR